MNPLQDLNDMKRQWRSQATPGPDLAALRERVAAGSRSHRRTLQLVGLATLAVILYALVHAWRDGRPEAWLGFLFITAFAAVVWVVALWLSRGTWQPRDGSTAAYLEVSIQRCRSVIIAAPVGMVLYVAGLAGSLAWKQRLLGADWSELLFVPSMIIAGWIGAPLYSAGVLWNAQRHRKQLAQLLNLKRQLLGEP
jgi:hypothetical protein